MKNNRFARIFMPLFALSSLLATAARSQDGRTDEKQAAEESREVKTFLYHKVEDFDKWKAAFDAAYDMRAAAGELSYRVGVFHHDPHIVYVLNEWASAEAFQAFMAKPELAEAMQKAGVLEPPQSVILDAKDKNAPLGNKVTTFVCHEVGDFASWKAVFDGGAEIRTAAGELSYEAGVFRENSKVVYVLNEWTSLEAFQSFMAKPELVEAMKKAGVVLPYFAVILDEKGTDVR